MARYLTRYVYIMQLDDHVRHIETGIWPKTSVQHSTAHCLLSRGEGAVFSLPQLPVWVLRHRILSNFPSYFSNVFIAFPSPFLPTVRLWGVEGGEGRGRTKDGEREGRPLRGNRTRVDLLTA